ncbi:MAG: PAS domain S-box protein [Candidatus Margulisiibacteriota bacterium]
MERWWHPHLFAFLFFLCTLSFSAVVILYKILKKLSYQLCMSEIKNAEEMFKQNQEIVTIMESSPIMIFYKDRENRIIRVNKVFTDLIGRTKSQVEGRSCFELFPKYGEKYWHDDMNVISTGLPKRNIIEKLETIYGEKWLQTDKFPVKDKRGAVIGLVAFSADITDRKKAAEKIRQDRIKQQVLLDSVFDAIFLETLDGKILDCNLAAEKLLGYSKEEFQKMKTSDLVPEEISQTFPKIVSSLSSKGEYRGEASNIKKNGERIPVEVYIKLIKLGKEEFVFTTIRDITQRKAFEQAIMQSEKKYKDLAESSHDFIYTIDSNGYISYVNEFGARQFGKSVKELLGANLQNLFPEEIAARQLSNIKKVFESGESLYISQPTRFPYKELWLGTWLIPLKDEKSGSVANVLGISRDITDRKIAEDALKESEERYRTVISSLPDAIVIYKNGKITFANYALLEKYGFSEKDIIGMDIADFVDENYKGLVYENILKREKGTSIGEYEIKVVSKDGRRIPVIVKGVSIKYDKEPATLIVLTDITEKKLAEEKILQLNENLEKEKDIAINASVAKTNFIANMSHGIRTPLSAIIAAADLLSGSRMDDKQKRCIQAVRYAGENLLSMVNSILDLAKIESGRFMLENRRFSIRGLLYRTIKMLEYSAKEKGLDLAFMIDSNVDEDISTDPLRLQEVLVNLIGNAIKFTDKGSVIVKAGYFQGNRNTLLFSVKDTGIGINPDQTERIFEKFSQMQVSITHKHSGTGLGLTISKQLVELMGGSIWLESTPDIGSTFYFTVKLKDPASTPELEDPSSQRQFAISPVKNAKILFVEDSETLRFLFKEYFSDLPEITVDVAEDGGKAVNMYEKGVYDIIFMDLKIPVLNGYEATKKIREIEKLSNRAHTPIIAVSAFCMPEEIQKTIEAGCDGHLTKPIKRDELLSFVFEHLKT